MNQRSAYITEHIEGSYIVSYYEDSNTEIKTDQRLYRSLDTAMYALIVYLEHRGCGILTEEEARQRIDREEERDEREQ